MDFSLACLLLLCVCISCGVEASPLMEGRIVGGRDVSITKHPHQVSVRTKSCIACAYQHSCGGSILNADTIITAAHCVERLTATNIVVVAGSDFRTGSDGSIARVAKIFSHPQYNASITDYDVALLFLATPLTLDELRIAAVKLVSAAPTSGWKAIVTGWGTTAEGGINAYTLQEAEVYVLDYGTCEAAYGDIFTDSMICAGAVGGGKDACQNDSGGPMIVQKQLAGVISFGVGCARPEFPGIYVNVAHVRNWIDSSIKENSAHA